MAPPGAAGDVVPAGFNYKIDVFHVINVTSAPVSLKLWRVAAGGASGNGNMVVPVTVLVPVATQTFPQFDVTVLWGTVLTVGEWIEGVAGAASSLVATADGIVVLL